MLKKLASKQSLQFNNQKIAHSFSLLKITAIKSLTEKNETIPVDSLYRLLNDKYGDLRFVTLNALMKYDKITIELITPLLNDKAKTVSKLAYDYLISKGVECEPVEIFFQNKPNV